MVIPTGCETCFLTPARHTKKRDSLKTQRTQRSAEDVKNKLTAKLTKFREV